MTTRRGFLGMLAGAVAAAGVAPFAGIARAAGYELEPETVQVCWARFCMLHDAKSGILEIKWRLPGQEWKLLRRIVPASRPMAKLTRNIEFGFHPQVVMASNRESLGLPVGQWRRDGFEKLAGRTVLHLQELAKLRREQK